MDKPQVEGHWHTLFEGFATSSLDFYELVKAGIARREIPDRAHAREGRGRSPTHHSTHSTMVRCTRRFLFLQGSEDSLHKNDPLP
jgi:hypothetical protein